MKWYKNLYMGDNAKKEKYKVFGHVVKERLQKDTFLIILSRSSGNLLEIVNSNFILQPHFKKKSVKSKIYVVGLAKGREEALELVRVIIDDVYQNTGAFNIREYLHFGNR